MLRHRSLRIAAAAALCLAQALTARVVLGDGVARIVQYRSELDDSIQEYGVYLPASGPPGTDGHPAVLHGHGYGWSVSKSFSDFQRQWAEEHGWVLINVNARGPNFYEGVGDIETLRVVEDATARFGLDRNRIYMTGGSMGGTGALRHGLRHPDVFAAVMGVDGWTDYRIWHWEWYAREDYRDLIEEFRRPLLMAASPLYWAERGSLGAVGHIVGGRDTVVLPEHGLRLHQRLRELRSQDPAGYDHKLIFNPLAGHVRGRDYRAIYGFFMGRERVENPASFHLRSAVLKHAELYWGRIEGFLIDGIPGGLEVDAGEQTVHVHTDNLNSFTLLLRASPLADASRVRVIADGFPCYEGPPESVTLSAELDEGGSVVGWRRSETRRSGLHKRPGLSGPVGEAFLRPFLVAWGTDGPPVEVARHRVEAEQFARDWNSFMIRADVVRAVPEHKLTRAQIRSRNVILFGSLDTSSLLRRADAAQPFPVRIGSERVIVRDPLLGDRRYVGEKYGAMMIYPNPLSDFNTFFVIANRRILTTEHGTSPQLLAYDLEKLPWAYPDYVVFNNDQSELPFVLNVNNKDHVTCYEAAYYVEAGFFDERWQIDHAGELRRVRRQRPSEHRLARINELSIEGSTALVRITDSEGDPVHTARVTGRWWGREEFVASASTDEEGVAEFPAPGDDLAEMAFEIVSVMATGCTWDRTADRARRLAPGRFSPAQVYLSPLDDRAAVASDGALQVRLLAHNATLRARNVRVSLAPPSGRVTPGRRELDLPPGGREEVEFTWWPMDRRPGQVKLHAEAVATGGETAAIDTRMIPVRVTPRSELPVFITDLSASSIDYAQPWKVSATLRNYDAHNSVETMVHCTIMEAEHHRAAKSVSIPADESVKIEWSGDETLLRGEYTVRVTVEGAYGITDTEQFAVR